jgi:hypothetical protein
MSANSAAARRARQTFDLAGYWYRHPVPRRHLRYLALSALISALLIASCVVGVLVWFMYRFPEW